MDEYSILWADDQIDVAQTLSGLIDVSVAFDFVPDAEEALEKIHQSSYNLLIIDLKMPPDDWGGLWLLERLKEDSLKIPPILVLSGEGAQKETIKAMRLGAKDYVLKDEASTELGNRVKEIIEGINSEEVELLDLIKKGESKRLEFKETLRWNIFAGRIDQDIQKSVLKTLAAFLNTNGGILLLGISDKGEILGLARDKFKDTDSLLLFLDDLIQSSLGDWCHELITVEKIITASDKLVLKINCKPSAQPAYINYPKNADKEFYIRRSASSVSLNIDDAVLFITNRFSA